MSKCPTGCGREPRAGCYLCTECWFALPRKQRIEFSQVYRAYMKAHQAHVVAMKIYRSARTLAVKTAQDAMSGRVG